MIYYKNPILTKIDENFLYNSGFLVLKEIDLPKVISNSPYLIWKPFYNPFEVEVFNKNDGWIYIKYVKYVYRNREWVNGKFKIGT